MKKIYYHCFKYERLIGRVKGGINFRPRGGFDDII